MIEYTIYPEGKRKILTFSFDDGRVEDERLVALFNNYGMKGSFHLIGSDYSDFDEEHSARLRELYAGHEISNHTQSHGWTDRMPQVSIINEIMQCRLTLERIAQQPVLGMSYPLGPYSSASVAAMAACGILYSRTTKATGGFNIPESFLEWHPTCKYDAAQPLKDRFLEYLDSPVRAPLFYIWGHSYEYDSEEKWAELETFLNSLAFNEKIWYATNLEIYNYITAQRSLRVSADERIISNPSATDVWVEKDRERIILIPAGETIFI